MTDIRVTFNTEYDHTETEFPVVVHVGESLFSRNGGNLTEMTDADKQQYQSFIEDVTRDEAIDEALSIVGTAPAYDDVTYSEVAAEHTTATVTKH